MTKRLLGEVGKIMRKTRMKKDGDGAFVIMKEEVEERYGFKSGTEMWKINYICKSRKFGRRWKSEWRWSGRWLCQGEVC